MQANLSTLNVIDLKFVISPLGGPIARLKYLRQRISAVHFCRVRQFLNAFSSIYIDVVSVLFGTVDWLLSLPVGVG